MLVLAAAEPAAGTPATGAGAHLRPKVDDFTEDAQMLFAPAAQPDQEDPHRRA